MSSSVVELQGAPSDAGGTAVLDSPGRLPLEAEIVGLDQAHPRRSRTDRPRRRWEPTIVFVLAFVIYSALGIRLIDQGVVVFDAMSRLAHAYFTVYNDPPKLAAIGFEWPPVMTLVLLPLGAIKPLATSMYALPLTSAVFGAGTIVVLNRALAFARVRPLFRHPLVLLFGLSPMMAFYSANGMSEAVYLFFLVAGVYAFMRWYERRQAHFLALSGTAMALATLCRYEMGLFALVMGVGVVAILAAQGAGRHRIEGALMLFVAPIAYGLASWMFFNWLIIGEPLFWLTHQVDANSGLLPGAFQADTSAGHLVGQLAELYLKLSPLALVVAPALAVVAVTRREPVSAVLATLILLPALITFVFVHETGNTFLLQLRYNMRAAPLAFLGAAWLFHVLRPRPARAAAWVVTAVALVASLPLGWNAMNTWPYQFGDSGFPLALRTGDNLEGRFAVGMRLGIRSENEMAQRVLALTDRPNSVLADDARTFGVMLLTGRPDLFVDRIDHGDRRWERVLRHPYGKVEYAVVELHRDDDIYSCYPLAAKGRQPGFELLLRNKHFFLVRVAERAPINAPGPRTDNPYCLGGGTP